MYKIILMNNLRTILDLGTNYGFITRWLVIGAFQNNGLVTSVDIHDRNLKSYFKYYEIDNHFKFIKADDRTLKWTKKVDLLFIDTSHKYEHTLFELNKYAKFAKMVFLHDILLEKDVRKAAREFAEKNNYNLYIWKTPLGLGQLRKPK